jgi:ABC-type amino acid transport substrate-binding protein
MRIKFGFCVIIICLFVHLQLDAEKYKVAFIEDYAPYSWMNEEGEEQGILVDWWKLWGEKMGVELEFEFYPIPIIISKLSNGQVDVAGGLFFSEERAQKLDYSESIIRMRTDLFLSNQIKVDSISVLDDSIAVVYGDMAHHFLLDQHPYLKLKVFSSFQELRDAVAEQQIEAFVYDVPNPLGKYRTLEGPKGYYMKETLFTQNLRPAVRKGNSKMLHLIISGSSGISNEDLFEIANQWQLVRTERTYLYAGLALLLLLVVIALLLVLYMTRYRKKAQKFNDVVAGTDWQVIIDKGENDAIEFKSSLRWDYKQEKINKALEYVIVKTISAFMNTDGGMLFIGIDDEGNALGLEKDYATFSKKNRDGFLLALTNLINLHLGKSSHRFIDVNIIAINEKDVCIVKIERSDRPVFLGQKDNEEFYIRASASSQPMGMREAYQYINSHWGK